MVRVIDILAKNLREFKYGKVPTVYLPFTGTMHRYLERYLTRIVGGTEGVYASLTKLLNEIVNDPETRETLFTITRAIRRYGATLNSISIIQRECTIRPCGTKANALKAYALTLIYGVAYSPIKTRCQILLSTPFTHAFMNVLLNAIAPEKYIDALRDFIECVVTVYPEPIENATQYCGETLSKWRAIGVENRNIDSVIDTLYSLIDKLIAQV
jgi:hypothetical protein